MTSYRVVLDTNLLVAANRSAQGASFAYVRQIVGEENVSALKIETCFQERQKRGNPANFGAWLAATLNAELMAGMRFWWFGY